MVQTIPIKSWDQCRLYSWFLVKDDRLSCTTPGYTDKRHFKIYKCVVLYNPWKNL